MQYKEAQNAFLDVIDPKEYVTLQHTASIYKSLRDALKKPLKMILLYGEPGTGKSMMLHKLYDDLKDTQTIILYDTPLDVENFLPRLSSDLLGESETSLTNFIEQSNKVFPQVAPIVLLDEAQLYDDKLMETIRLISDSRRVRFVISLHKTDEEDLIAKSHFQTRIWESFELTNAPKEDIEKYIHNKLLQNDLPDVLDILNKKLLDLIYEYADGNFRNTHMILYTFLDLYKSSDRGETPEEILKVAAIKCNLAKKQPIKSSVNNKNYKNFLLAMSMAIALGIGGYSLVINKKTEHKVVETIQPSIIKKELPLAKHETISQIKKYEPQIIEPSYSFLTSIPSAPYVEQKIKNEEPKTIRLKDSIFEHTTTSYSQLEGLLQRYKESKSSKVATYIANVYFSKNNFKDAYRYSVEANELDPSSQTSWIVTAKALFKMDKKQDAIRILKSYLLAYNSQEIKNLLFKMLSGEYK